MEIGDIKISDEMWEVASEAFLSAPLNLFPDDQRLGFALVAAIRWLRDKVLHPANVDFHRAIMNAERDYYLGSDQDTSVIARRVDFEYGVSFARNYLSGMFSAKPAPLLEMIGGETLSEFCSRYRRIDEAVRDAYRRGREMGGF